MSMQSSINPMPLWIRSQYRFSREDVVRLFALTPCIFTVLHTRSLNISLLFHFTINAFAEISLPNLIWRLK